MSHLIIKIFGEDLNPLNAELNSLCHLLALLGAHQIIHVSRARVKPRVIISVNNEPTNLSVRNAASPVENTSLNEQNTTLNSSCHICVTSL